MSRTFTFWQGGVTRREYDLKSPLSQTTSLETEAALQIGQNEDENKKSKKQKKKQIHN